MSIIVYFDFFVAMHSTIIKKKNFLCKLESKSVMSYD